MNQPIRISPEMIRLYDEYTHLTLDRRKFMSKLTQLTGSAAAAAAIVPLLEANQARAAMVPENDARLKPQNITYPGAAGEMKGYLVLPVEVSGKLPALIVIHENRGLNPHIRDVARRFALQGFLALAPDFLAPAGGTPANEDQARDMIGKLDPAQTVANAVATVTFLKQHSSSNGKVGAVGFCWGGGVVNQLAVHAPDLAAAVAYYGSVPDAADVPKIKAKLLLHYAGLDERINAGIPAFRKALETAKIDHRIYLYEGANHAFNNDTSEARYNKEAADLAWSRTIEFLKSALS
jgi:carboxymethylenebutenolidase